MAAANFKKGDVVRVAYKAYIADIKRLYDTTDEAAAKEAGIYNEKYTYAPMPYIVGSGKLFKALDAAIMAAQVGKEQTLEIPSAEAAGPRDLKLIETYPLREFYKQQINPYPGLEVKLGDRSGTVISAGAGRVKVDFNNPLAGKDLSYTFTVTDLVTEPVEKAKAIVQMDFGTADGFSFDIKADKVCIILPDVVKFSQEWPVIKYKIVSDMRDSFAVDTVEFIEIWSKAPAADVAKKDAAKKDKKDDDKAEKKAEAAAEKKTEKDATSVKKKAVQSAVKD
jgi:FKBP-type peptidyl-prolyl cis-trans isomerase 2